MMMIKSLSWRREVNPDPVPPPKLKITMLTIIIWIIRKIPKMEFVIMMVMILIVVILIILIIFHDYHLWKMKKPCTLAACSTSFWIFSITCIIINMVELTL